MKPVAILLAFMGLAGCTGIAERTIEIDRDETNNKAHPRALLLQRVMPSCLWWCTATTTVSNSEGVKASGTGGNLSTSEAQTSTTTTQQTFSPSQTIAPAGAAK